MYMKVYDSLTVEKESQGIIEEIIPVLNFLKLNAKFDGSEQVIILFDGSTNEEKCKISFWGELIDSKKATPEQLKSFLNLALFIGENMGSPNSTIMKCAMKDFYLLKWYAQLFDESSIKGFKQDIKFLLNNLNDKNIESRLIESLNYLDELLKNKQTGNFQIAPNFTLKYQ